MGFFFRSWNWRRIISCTLNIVVLSFLDPYDNSRVNCTSLQLLMSSVSLLGSPVDRVSRSLSYQQLSNPRHGNINFCCQQIKHNACFSWQPEPRLRFLPCSVSTVSSFSVPFVCLRCTLSPPRVSIQFKPVSVYQTQRRSLNGRSQNIKCLTSSSFVWAAGSPRTHTHTHTRRRGGTKRTHTETHTRVCVA